ncbi:phosphoinositide-binding protein, putative [Plasmodium gallinaceum]|uniref:Phosphoinositide-binding protein, putative n=1 Tax=Plasmodium gallinaceum TaxID=5849 RepID=A0A1J1GPC5_PLAGA|nr:phosphoinositide-binding protein, putative [Plasmodium gallinaceum]CRG93135.1 phosphoinositide-binding protein, putative [Plasmodium gallinaceum]
MFNCKMEEYSSYEFKDNLTINIIRTNIVKRRFCSYTEYILEFKVLNSQKILKKRFSDFFTFYIQLKDELNDKFNECLEKISVLPSKKLFGRFNYNFIEERRQKLELFLKNIAKNKNVYLCDNFYDFLCLDNITKYLFKLMCTKISDYINIQKFLKKINYILFMSRSNTLKSAECDIINFLFHIKKNLKLNNEMKFFILNIFLHHLTYTKTPENLLNVQLMKFAFEIIHENLLGENINEVLLKTSSETILRIVDKKNYVFLEYLKIYNFKEICTIFNIINKKKEKKDDEKIDNIAFNIYILVSLLLLSSIHLNEIQNFFSMKSNSNKGISILGYMYDSQNVNIQIICCIILSLLIINKKIKDEEVIYKTKMSILLIQNEIHNIKNVDYQLIEIICSKKNISLLNNILESLLKDKVIKYDLNLNDIDNFEKYKIEYNPLEKDLFYEQKVKYGDFSNNDIILQFILFIINIGISEFFILKRNYKFKMKKNLLKIKLRKNNIYRNKKMKLKINDKKIMLNDKEDENKYLLQIKNSDNNKNEKIEKNDDNYSIYGIEIGEENEENYEENYEENRKKKTERKKQNVKDQFIKNDDNSNIDIYEEKDDEEKDDEEKDDEEDDDEEEDDEEEDDDEEEEDENYNEDDIDKVRKEEENEIYNIKEEHMKKKKEDSESTTSSCISPLYSFSSDCNSLCYDENENSMEINLNMDPIKNVCYEDEFSLDSGNIKNDIFFLNKVKKSNNSKDNNSVCSNNDSIYNKDIKGNQYKIKEEIKNLHETRKKYVRRIRRINEQIILILCNEKMIQNIYKCTNLDNYKIKFYASLILSYIPDINEMITNNHTHENVDNDKCNNDNNYNNSENNMNIKEEIKNLEYFPNENMETFSKYPFATDTILIKKNNKNFICSVEGDYYNYIYKFNILNNLLFYLYNETSFYEHILNSVKNFISDQSSIINLKYLKIKETELINTMSFDDLRGNSKKRMKKNDKKKKKKKKKKENFDIHEKINSSESIIYDYNNNSKMSSVINEENCKNDNNEKNCTSNNLKRINNKEDLMNEENAIVENESNNNQCVLYDDSKIYNHIQCLFSYVSNLRKFGLLNNLIVQMYINIRKKLKSLDMNFLFDILKKKVEEKNEMKKSICSLKKEYEYVNFTYNDYINLQYESNKYMSIIEKLYEELEEIEKKRKKVLRKHKYVHINVCNYRKKLIHIEKMIEESPSIKKCLNEELNKIKGNIALYKKDKKKLSFFILLHKFYLDNFNCVLNKLKVMNNLYGNIKLLSTDFDKNKNIILSEMACLISNDIILADLLMGKININMDDENFSLLLGREKNIDNFNYNICNENKLIIINKENKVTNKKDVDLFKVNDILNEKYKYYFNDDNILNMEEKNMSDDFKNLNEMEFYSSDSQTVDRRINQNDKIKNVQNNFNEYNINNHNLYYNLDETLEDFNNDRKYIEEKKGKNKQNFSYNNKMYKESFKKDFNNNSTEMYENYDRQNSEMDDGENEEAFNTEFVSSDEDNADLKKKIDELNNFKNKDLKSLLPEDIKIDDSMNKKIFLEILDIIKNRKKQIEKIISQQNSQIYKNIHKYNNLLNKCNIQINVNQKKYIKLNKQILSIDTNCMIKKSEYIYKTIREWDDKINILNEEIKNVENEKKEKEKEISSQKKKLEKKEKEKNLKKEELRLLVTDMYKHNNKIKKKYKKDQKIILLILYNSWFLYHYIYIIYLNTLKLKNYLSYKQSLNEICLSSAKETILNINFFSELLDENDF